MNTFSPWTIRSFLTILSRSHIKYLVGMAMATVLWAIDDSAIRPYLLKLIIDIMSDTTTVPTHTEHLWYIIALYITIRMSVSLLVRWWDWLHVHLVPSLKATTMQKLTTYAVGHAYGFTHQHGAGTLASSISTAAEGAPQLLVPFVGRFLGSTCRVLFALALFWYTLPLAAFFMTLWVLFFLTSGITWAYIARSLADNAANTYAQVTGELVDTLTNRISILLCNQTQHEAKIASWWGKKWITSEQTRDLALVKLYLIQGISFVIFELLSLAIIVKGWQAGTITAGDASLVVSVNMVLLEALWDIPQEVTQFVRALGRVSQGLRTIMVPYHISEAPGAPQLEVSTGTITFERVHFGYNTHKSLFSNLSTKIKAGQKVGIVGYSGSGKTTFVHLLLRFFDIQSGRILIDQQNIATVTQESLRHAITFLPQEPILFRRSLRENICYCAETINNEMMEHAAKLAGIHDLIMSFPKGYDTVVGLDEVHFSLGQRQRIMFARAFLKNTPIIIMDEATSALDSVAEQEIHASMQLLTAGKTTLVIAHRLSTLLTMDRILVFDQGAIVEDGIHDDLIALKGHYYTLWQTQTCMVV